jgi:RNA polymerase-interacting CarD/CdnL/TRCF family regulator
VHKSDSCREAVFVDQSAQAISEKGLCVKARQRLSGEIGLARGLDRAEVDAWIDEQLAPIGS